MCCIFTMVKALFSVYISFTQSASHLVVKWALETHFPGSYPTTTVDNDLSLWFHICKMGITIAYFIGLL